MAPARSGRALHGEGNATGGGDDAGAYPDLADAQEHVARVTLAEEERFVHTLRIGLRLVDSLVAEVKAGGRATIPGAEIFRLYDTYGFPVDLLRDIAADNRLVLDESGFEQAMAEQRTRARESWVGSARRRSRRA